MLRPELSNASRAFAQEVERIALPLEVPGAIAGRAFRQQMEDVRRDVTAFIENGSGSLGSMTLSAEGSMQRARLAAGGNLSDEQRAFVASVTPWAQDAGQKLGVSPDIIAAHAALESNWGREPLRNADGSSTNNLFGLKASGAWRGDVAHAMTTEVEDGVAVKRTEDFRSYGDVAHAFQDYAQLLLDNPRYRGALNAGSDIQAFATGLAGGRYATDPAYATKLESVARRLRGAGIGY